MMDQALLFEDAPRYSRLNPSATPHWRLQLPADSDWTGDDWATPAWLIDQLQRRYGTFELDPCCRPETAKAPRYFTRADNGLIRPWAPARVFCNPPYSNPRPWMLKARHEVVSGALVVFLLPAATEAGWFQQLALAELWFLRRRQQFLGPRGQTVGHPRYGSVVAALGPGIRHGTRWAPDCAVCQRPFFPSRVDARTCSAACRQSFHRSQLGLLIRDNRRGP